MKRAVAGLAILVAAVFVAAPGSASEKAALGTWDVVASTPDGPLPSVMTVTKGEGKAKIKAEIELGGIKRTVSEEAVEGDVLKMKVEYEGVVYAIQGKIAGNALEGTWEGGGNSGALTAKRRP